MFAWQCSNSDNGWKYKKNQCPSYDRVFVGDDYMEGCCGGSGAGWINYPCGANVGNTIQSKSAKVDGYCCESCKQKSKQTGRYVSC